MPNKLSKKPQDLEILIKINTLKMDDLSHKVKKITEKMASADEAYMAPLMREKWSLLIERKELVSHLFSLEKEYNEYKIKAKEKAHLFFNNLHLHNDSNVPTDIVKLINDYI